MEDDGRFWISFDEDEPYIFGGPAADVEAAWSGRIQFDCGAYWGLALISEAQLSDLKCELACMDRFIAMVVAERERLLGEIVEREGQERLRT